MKIAIVSLCVACVALGAILHAALVLPQFLECREEAQIWESAARKISQMCSPLQPEPEQ